MIDQELLLKYLDGTLEGKDASLLMQWVRESPENERMLLDLKQTSVSLNYNPEKDSAGISDEWERFRRNTGMRRCRSGLLRWLPVAACLLLVAGLMWGARIFSGPAKGNLMMVKTGYGQEATAILPDGSTVLLNSCSTLSYDPAVWPSRREVSIVGEAAFDVVHNKKAAFKVTAPDFQVTVLGTSFNVSDYEEDEDAFVALKRGGVMVSLADAEVRLMPGETCYLEKASYSYRVAATNKGGLSWEDNLLLFENTSLDKVCQKLHRHFGYTFDIAEDCLGMNYRAHLKDESLTEFLDMLRAVTPNLGYSIDQDGRKVRIFLKK